MDDYQVKTPEQVNISYSIAGLGTRFLALSIDIIIQTITISVLILSLYGSLDFGFASQDLYLAVIIIIFAVIYYLYFLIFELILKGRTPGKALLHIRVVRMDGRAVDLSGIVLRNLIRLIDFLPGFYTVGAICMFVNKDSRRLGDIVAGTIVVRDERKVTLSSILASQTQALQTPLNDDEYPVVRDFIARKKNLSKEVRQKLSQEIARPIFERLQTPLPERANAEQFLENLLK